MSQHKRSQASRRLYVIWQSLLPKTDKMPTRESQLSISISLPPLPWAPQARNTRSPASPWSFLVTSCDFSSVTEGEVILLIPLLTRPPLVGTDAYFSMGKLYFQKAEVEGSSLSFSLDENYKYSPLTLDKKSLIFLISHDIHREEFWGVVGIHEKEINGQISFLGLENENGFLYYRTSQSLWHVTIYMALQEWGCKKYF